MTVAHKATKQAHDLNTGLRILHRTTVESNNELKPIREQFETVVNVIEKQIKKRGRKPKTNG